MVDFVSCDEISIRLWLTRDAPDGNYPTKRDAETNLWYVGARGHDGFEIAKRIGVPQSSIRLVTVRQMVHHVGTYAPKPGTEVFGNVRMSCEQVESGYYRIFF